LLLNVPVLVPGDLVYGPFLGSGTTAVVAEWLNRNWLASEISAEYYGIAMDHLCQNRER
jgi:DNA modification methylase